MAHNGPKWPKKGRNDLLAHLLSRLAAVLGDLEAPERHLVRGILLNVPVLRRDIGAGTRNRRRVLGSWDRRDIVGVLGVHVAASATKAVEQGVDLLQDGPEGVRKLEYGSEQPILAQDTPRWLTAEQSAFMFQQRKHFMTPWLIQSSYRSLSTSSPTTGKWQPIFPKYSTVPSL
jgi:hypothetical protein